MDVIGSRQNFESFLMTDPREVLQEGGRAMDAALAALFCNGIGHAT